MKKTILSLAILFAASTGISAFAQTTDNGNNTKNRTEMKDRKGGDRKGALNPFEGLNLTDQQKAKLEELKQADIKQKKQLKEQSKQLKEQKKAEAKAKKDAARQKRAQERRDYLAKIKSILTPEQYVQYLENNFVNKVDKQASRKGGKDGKFDRRGAKDKKMVRKGKKNRNFAKGNKS